jgi:hypothetical protein
MTVYLGVEFSMALEALNAGGVGGILQSWEFINMGCRCSYGPIKGTE